MVNITQLVIRHFEDEIESNLRFAFFIVLISSTFWYLLQKRELKRFFQQLDAENKEIRAVRKEVDVTNVLNL